MSVSAQSGVTSPVTGQVSFGWIGDAWRLFSAQMGVWILALLVFIVPMVIFFVVLYAMMLTKVFAGGFPPAPRPIPAGNPFPAVGTNPMLAGGFPTEIFALEIGFGLLFSLWSAYLYGGLFGMAVRQVRGLPIELRDVFRGGPLFGRMLGAMFLLGFGTYGLEALCLAPFGLLAWWLGPTATTITGGVLGAVLIFVLVFVLMGLLLPAFALMADGDGVFVALKRSLRAMRSQWGAAAGFVFVLGVLVYASEIPCGLGLLATVPMVFLICALAYRDMVGMPDMAAPPAPVYPAAAAGTWPPPPTMAPQQSAPQQAAPQETE